MKVTPPPAGSLGAEIRALDLRSLTAACAAALHELVHRHKLLIVRDVELDDRQYVALAHKLGRPQVYFQDHYHHPQHPEIFVSSNVPMDGKKVGVAGTGRFWHSDYQFFDEPLSLTTVYPKVIPRGRRATLFVDMTRVLAALPSRLREALAGRTCFHEAVLYYKVQPRDVDRAIAELMEEFRRLSPGARHPAIVTHPVTGEQALYVSEGFTMAVDGCPHEQSRALLDELFAFIRRPEHVHAHDWRAGDLMIWENRTLVHMSSGIPDGQPSVSYRIGVYDGLPFYVGCKLIETALPERVLER